MADKGQELLKVPSRNECKEDTACASRENMSLTATGLERKSEIEIYIMVNTYQWDAGEVKIYDDM